MKSENKSAFRFAHGINWLFNRIKIRKKKTIEQINDSIIKKGGGNCAAPLFVQGARENFEWKSVIVLSINIIWTISICEIKLR